MIRQHPEAIKDTPPLKSKINSFNRGLNKLVSNTQLKSNELSEAVNIQLIEDGKVMCPRMGQAYYGAEVGSKVTGLTGYYKADGTRELIRMCGTTLQKYNAGSWDNISGFAYTTGLDADMVTAYDNLYICNGTDVLTKYDGTSISSFTSLDAPVMTSVTRTGGSAGSYTFSYKVTAVSENGETLPSSAGTATVNQATLSSTVYMTIVWEASENAVGYNIYGRKDGSWYFIAYVEGGSTLSYIDNGTITPTEVFAPPEANTTQGPKGKYIASYKDTIFIYGDPDNPSRLYYSGGGDKVDDFSIGNGGGFIDISKNDGTVGTGMIQYRNTLIVFKEDSIYQFDFTSSGLPSITQINPAVGAISRRSIVMVENDIYFASRRGIFTVGNEPGFSFDVLRTNEISARIRPVFQQINASYMSDIAAIYATADNYNLVIFAYTPAGETTNSKAIVFDRERLAWYEWTDIQANCWTQYNPSLQGGATRVLYGDDSSGYVKQILTGSDDFGSGIHGYFKTASDDFGDLNVYKNLRDIDIIMRNPQGSVTLDILSDGITTEKTVSINTIYPSINWGHYVFSSFLLGESYGTGISSQDENVIRTLRNNNIEGRSFLLSFDNNSSASFILLEADMTCKERSERYRHSEDIISN